MLHWCDHAKRSGPVAKGLVQFTDFMLDEKSDLRDNWWQTYVLHEEESKLYAGLLEREKEATRLLAKTIPPPLHMCARLGLTEWVRHILDKLNPKQAKVAVNTGDVHGVPPLMWGGNRRVMWRHRNSSLLQVLIKMSCQLCNRKPSVHLTVLSEDSIRILAK